MTALQKPGGRQDDRPATGKSRGGGTAEFQNALATRAGRECIAHALQALSEIDPESTVLSVGGISPDDLISWWAMLSALARVEGGGQVLPFVKLFHDAPSQYWWEDEVGVVHEVDQGEGCGQGGAMMPRSSRWINTMRSPWCRISGDLEKCSSPFRATNILSAALRGLAWSTLCWRKRCGDVPASRCMQARRKCGIGRASDQKLAISSKGEHTLRWKGRECGEEGLKQRREAVRLQKAGQQTLLDRIPSLSRRAVSVGFAAALRSSRCQLLRQSCAS